MTGTAPAGYIPAGAGADPSRFWAPGRPELDALRHEAQRRIMSPWAVLGMSLGQSLCAIPYTVRYRSDFSPEGTPLNLAMALVGPPGSGKSSADRAASAVLTFGDGEDPPGLEPVRSGEGIPGVFAYLETEKDDDGNAERFTRYRRTTHAHRILWDEVGVFGAQASRTGSTLIETVNTAATGGALGGQASKGDGLTLTEGDYRAVVVLNAQPARADGLVDAHALASGLTARLQWIAATDPSLANAPRPTTPGERYHIRSTQWDDIAYVDALPEMNAQHEHDKRAAQAGLLPAEHGHRTTRAAIIAAALANMAGRAHLERDDWHRACYLVAHSDRVLDTVRDALAEPDPVEADRAHRLEERLRDRLDALQADGWAFHEARRKLSRPQGHLLTELLKEGRITKW